MDFELSEELKMLKDMAYKFAVTEITPSSKECDEHEKYTPEIRKKAAENGLVAAWIPEEYGGDTMFVDVSAVTHEGLERLLEAIVLTADASLDLRANPDMPAQGVAIEAHLDKGRGPVATVLVHRGTLRIGDSIVAGSAHGRVRALINDQGENVTEALPSMPVQVLGLTSVPGAGDNFFDLGGHSLQLIRVHGLLESRLGRELSLVDL